MVRRATYVVRGIYFCFDYASHALEIKPKICYNKKWSAEPGELLPAAPQNPFRAPPNTQGHYNAHRSIRQVKYYIPRKDVLKMPSLPYIGYARLISIIITYSTESASVLRGVAYISPFSAQITERGYFYTLQEHHITGRTQSQAQRLHESISQTRRVREPREAGSA